MFREESVTSFSKIHRYFNRKNYFFDIDYLNYKGNGYNNLFYEIGENKEIVLIYSIREKNEDCLSRKIDYDLSCCYNDGVIIYDENDYEVMKKYPDMDDSDIPNIKIVTKTRKIKVSYKKFDLFLMNKRGIKGNPGKENKEVRKEIWNVRDIININFNINDSFILEYKRSEFQQDRCEFQFECLEKLGNKLKLPVYLIVYNKYNNVLMRTKPLNNLAETNELLREKIKGCLLEGGFNE